MPGRSADREATRIQLFNTKTKLADTAIGAYMNESLCYRLTAMIDDRLGLPDGDQKKLGAENARAIEEYAVECSIAKVYASECLDFVVDETV